MGFPGESDADFQQTLSLVEKVQFEAMFSFKYSPRPHTAAEDWPDELPEETKTRRLIQLQQMQKGIQLRLHQEHYLGRHLEVLVEGTARDGVRRFGRTSTNKVVNFPGTDRPGTFTEVFITDVGPNSLVGQKTTDRQQNCA